MNKNELKNPSKKYRPAPFWSWNEKLDVNETRLQVRQMEQAGLGGYFMHARGGLQTEYLSDEWYDNILAACDEGKKSGMLSWGYDENGWPSGFGGGLVNGLGEKYQQKYLRCSVTSAPENTPRTITNLTYEGKNLHFYYDVNPFYVDTLSKVVIAEFIRVTHQAYKDTMGEKWADMKGFFTDEPQISRNGFPWSLDLEEAYSARYGEDIKPLLAALFFDTEDCKRVRYNYWALVRDMFAEAFMKQIGDWCRQNGSALTGHMVIEEGFPWQIISNGACMPHYEYMDIPGVDNLGRRFADLQLQMQVVSAANQLGKKQILTESFALCGWNVNFEELRNIYEDQLVHGINFLCQHLEGYSLRGIRKRDYPASLFCHQPWWKDYRIFNDTVSRIGYLVAEGEVNADVLLLHGIESGWTDMKDAVTEGEYSHISTAEADNWCKKMADVMWTLERNQIQYHLGDDRIMSRYGKVENGKFVIGEQKYSLVIVPETETLGITALALLKEFKAQGGEIIFINALPTYVAGVKTDEFSAVADKIIPLGELKENLPDSVRRIKLSATGGEEKHINLLVRSFPDQKMYYLHNRHDIKQTVTAEIKGGSALIFDPVSGEETSAVFEKCGENIKVSLDIEACGSAILFVYEDDRVKTARVKDKLPFNITRKLKGEWKITSDEDNILTLDYCDLYFDDECAGKNIPISDVQEMALAFGRKVKTEVVFKFNVKEKAFSRMRLAVETPEIFDIKVNGKEVDKTVLGIFHDPAFNLIDIAPFAIEGENEVSLVCMFDQSDRVRDMAEKSLIFESEKNKLFYDMEIEAVYITGDFGVESDKPFTESANRGLITEGAFSIVKQNRTVKDGAVAPQGFPFFAGSMTFKKTVTLTAEEAENAQIAFSSLCSNVTSVKVNGKTAGEILWQPYSLDLAGLLHEGENVFEITVKGNLRNMLGPFHLNIGECLSVGPGAFFHNSPIWLKGSAGASSSWVDSYCFVEFGLFF
ncbi:MAG: glycosyl hydrolase [Acutalibacteraceae bacterium]|nr:glycosyl hydrolase [Acutalibacteraceae bacterium]